MNRREWLYLLTGYAAGGLSAFASSAGSKQIAYSEFTLPEAELFGLHRSSMLAGEGFKLLKPAAQAFEVMRADAEKAGIRIYSVSSYRSFDHQSRIWNRKYETFLKSEKSPQKAIDRILEYSTIPGTSRHHWGTDLDMIDLSPKQPSAVLSETNFMEGGAYHRFYQWLNENANRYGFYEVYTNNPDRTGFSFEPWHWSYAELSIPLLEQFVALSLPGNLPLRSLSGGQYLTKEFLEEYRSKWLLGIDPKLIPADLR